MWVCVSSSFCTLPLLLSEPLAPCPFHSGLQTTVASAKVWWSRSGCSPAGFGKKRHRYQCLGCTPQSMYFDKLSSMKPMGLPNMLTCPKNTFQQVCTCTCMAQNRLAWRVDRLDEGSVLYGLWQRCADRSQKCAAIYGRGSVLTSTDCLVAVSLKRALASCCNGNFGFPRARWINTHVLS